MVVKGSFACEKSRGRLRDFGQPPYGCTAVIVPHPNPVKAERSKTKSRLEPDGLRGQAVTQMAHWRYHEGLGCTTIARRLNAKLGGPRNRTTSR